MVFNMEVPNIKVEPMDIPEVDVIKENSSGYDDGISLYDIPKLENMSSVIYTFSVKI